MKIDDPDDLEEMFKGSDEALVMLQNSSLIMREQMFTLIEQIASLLGDEYGDATSKKVLATMTVLTACSREMAIGALSVMTHLDENTDDAKYMRNITAYISKLFDDVTIGRYDGMFDDLAEQARELKKGVTH